MNPLYKSSSFITYFTYISYLVGIFSYICFIFYYLINENFAKNLHLFLIISFFPILCEFIRFLIKLKYIEVNENNIIIRSLHGNNEKVLEYKDIQSINQYTFNSIIIKIKYKNNETNKLNTMIVMPEVLIPKEDKYVLFRFRVRPEMNITKYLKREVLSKNPTFSNKNIHSPYLYVAERVLLFSVYFIIFMYIFFKF